MNFVDDIQSQGGTVRPGATDEAIATLNETVIEEFGVELPEDYIAFLKEADGLMWNGLVLYASAIPVRAPDRARIPAFLERNRFWDEILELDDVLVLGDVDDELLAFNVDTLEYLQLDGNSADIIERYAALEEMLEAVVAELTP